MQIKKITDLISNTTEQSLPSCVKSEILSSFENFNPEKYAKTRNYLDGHISRLSIAIKHGIVTNQEIFNLNKQKYSYIESEKFIQELAWRDFWRSYAYQNPDYLWKDVEEYKTGLKSPSNFLEQASSQVRNKASYKAKQGRTRNIERPLKLTQSQLRGNGSSNGSNDGSVIGTEGL